jgi:hypothetical protein
MNLRAWLFVMALALAAPALTGFAAAQEKAAVPVPAAAPPPPARDAEGHVVMSWDMFKKVTGFDETRRPDEAAGMFTLSWDEVQNLLGIKIQDVGQAKVRLPWQEFKALLMWSIEQKQKPAAPPSDWAVTAAEYAGTLTKDGATFTATFKINVLKEKDWKTIPLLPASVAIEEITLPQNAYLRQANNFYEVLTTATGPMEVKAKFACAVTEQAGSLSLRFDRVPSATCLLDLQVAQAGVAINVTGAQSVVKKEEGGATRLAAALPAAQAIQVSWERAIPEPEKVPPKLYAETQTLIAVGDGIIVGRERINFSILHTGVRVLKLKVPPGVSILEVKGDRLRDWRVAQDELAVSLNYEALGDYVLNVTYEQPAAVAQVGNAPLPVLRALDVVREKGHIGVVALANVELSAPKLDGATAIDVRELPPELLGMTGQPVLLAFRYVAEKFDIPLAIKKHEDVSVLVTIVDSAVITTMQTDDGRRITKAVYNVRNNRQQFLRLAMAEGVDIWSASVSGKSIRPARDEQKRILIPLVRSEGASSGLAAFPVEIVYVERSDDPAKRPPPAGVLHIELPRASEPVTHLMVNLYLPMEGKYLRPWSSEPWIEGPLSVVKAFRQLLAAPDLPPIDAQGAANAIQAAAQAQADAAAAAAGATPIRVNLPIDGQLFRLEKILVLDEPLFMDIHYSGWEKK